MSSAGSQYDVINIMQLHSRSLKRVRTGYIIQDKTARISLFEKYDFTCGVVALK